MFQLTGLWVILAHPLTVLVLGALVIIGLFFTRKNATEAAAARLKVGRIFSLSLTTYVFGICALGQIGFKGNPSIAEIIKDGFGEERTAYLLLAYVAIGIYDLLDGFFPRAPT